MRSSFVDRLLDLDDRRVIEVGHVLREGIPAFSDHSPYRHLPASAETDALAYRLDLHEHVGTHVDAPCHWPPGGNDGSAESFDPFALIGECRVVDSTDARDAEQLVGTTRAGLAATASAPGTIVLFHFGWDRFWSNPPRYLADWPGLSAELASELIDRGVRAVGTDAPAIDAAGPHGMPAHEVLLGAAVPVMENLCNLAAIGEGGLLVAIPLRIADGSGSPIRPFVIPGPYTAVQ